MSRAMNPNDDDRAWEQRLRRAYSALRATARRTAPSFEALTVAAVKEAGQDAPVNPDF